jgi:hypothetical protein
VNRRDFLTPGTSAAALSLPTTAGCTTTGPGDPEARLASIDAGALISVGANVGINTRDVRQPIIGFVLTNAGFMADFSMNGTRTARLSP